LQSWSVDPCAELGQTQTGRGSTRANTDLQACQVVTSKDGARRSGTGTAAAAAVVVVVVIIVVVIILFFIVIVVIVIVVIVE
jgi:hypothetical protein